MSGKAGKAYFHVGSASTVLNPLWQIVNTTPIPITQMVPTHMAGRGKPLLEDGKKWIKVLQINLIQFQGWRSP